MAGKIGWLDLTTGHVPELLTFYEKVAGWKPSPVNMGEYDDYNMIPAGETTPVAGICHAQGANATIPPVWMVYITVDNLQISMDAVRENGGEVLEHRDFGTGGMAFVRDPAGAICALFQAPE